MRDKYMQRALQLAQNGIGTTRPNPSVGAVVVYKDLIIGEGFTSPYGGVHAEVNAINSVENKELLEGSTLYVTLEPCSHYGKTPPCSQLIISSNIPNVVIGCFDENPLVAGKGIEQLRNSGCSVTVGVFEEECKEHHKRFLTFQMKKRPYIILKWAETLDGFIAPTTKKENKPVWISNPFSRQLAHKLRTTEHAILVGTNTVIADNPTLNVRSWGGNNPIRVVLDRDLRIPTNSNVFSGNQTTIVITQEKIKFSKDLIYETIDFSKNIINQICEVLFKHKIQSLIVEGGAKTLESFIEENIWDEAYVFKSDVIFKTGIKAPNFNFPIVEEIAVDNDKLLRYRN